MKFRNTLWATWCEKYPDEVKSILKNIRNFIPEKDRKQN